MIKKKFKNITGIAIVAMLLGSNVEYALNNYGILTRNFSYASLSDTGDTGGTEGTEDSGTDFDDGFDETAIGPDGQVVKVKKGRYDREWDHCTFKKGTEYTVQYGLQCGLTIKKGEPISGLEGVPVDKGKGMGKYEKASGARVACADRKLPDGDKMFGK